MKDAESKNGRLGAFPYVDALKNSQPGLTKREYFAIMALQGLCAGRTEYEKPGANIKQAVELADQLLEALSTQD